MPISERLLLVNSEARYSLVIGDRSTYLERRLGKSTEIFEIDFNSSAMQSKLRHAGKEHPLAKAVGIGRYPQPLQVVDATAGVGRDGFLLAYLGAKVTLIERVPFLATLLADGLRRAAELTHLQPHCERITLKAEDSLTWLETLTVAQAPDVIYLDPMFPARRKSAKVKKEMQFLHALLPKVDNDNESAALLHLARSKARYRVVVKRPKQAKFLADCQPSHSITTPSLRFDVYMSVNRI